MVLAAPLPHTLDPWLWWYGSFFLKSWSKRCGTDIYTTIYIYNRFEKKKTNKPRNLLYSTRNYIQYLIITYSGKESKTEYVCVCVCVYTYINQYARYLKDCKITMLQFRNFFKKEKDTGRLPNSCTVNSSMDYLLFGLFPAPFKFQGFSPSC